MSKSPREESSTEIIFIGKWEIHLTFAPLFLPCRWRLFLFITVLIEDLDYRLYSISRCFESEQDSSHRHRLFRIPIILRQYSIRQDSSNRWWYYFSFKMKLEVLDQGRVRSFCKHYSGSWYGKSSRWSVSWHRWSDAFPN
jgi:hypothetical protein